MVLRYDLIFYTAIPFVQEKTLQRKRCAVCYTKKRKRGGRCRRAGLSKKQKLRKLWGVVRGVAMLICGSPLT